MTARILPFRRKLGPPPPHIERTWTEAERRVIEQHQQEFYRSVKAATVSDVTVPPLTEEALFEMVNALETALTPKPGA